jgi:hypothetical protein
LGEKLLDSTKEKKPKEKDVREFKSIGEEIDLKKMALLEEETQAKVRDKKLSQTKQEKDFRDQDEEEEKNNDNIPQKSQIKPPVEEEDDDDLSGWNS